MTLILDAGALIAVERGNRDMMALMKRDLLAGRVPRTHGGIVGQVWRNGSRQASLARLLAGTDVAALDESLGRQAGTLLGRTGGKDIIDAAVILLAADGDMLLTSDPADLFELACAAGVHVDLVAV